MKKLTLLLSVFVIFAMILAACEPADTEPGVGTPGIPDTGETPLPGLDTPEVLETPDETPVVPVDTPEMTPEETPEMTPEAETPEMTPEETPELTPEAETPEATPEETPVGTPVVVAEDEPSRANNLLNLPVRNMEDEALGDAVEMILNVQEETVSHVVVGVGGFLGIGERNVAIPYEELTLQQDENDNWMFLLDADREMIENAPEIDLDTVDLGAAGWEAEFDAYWQEGGAAAPGAAQQTPTATPEDGDDATPTPAAPGATGLAVNSVRLTVLIGSEVMDATAGAAPGAQDTPVATPGAQDTPVPGQEMEEFEVIGSVEEVIVDTDTGDVHYLVVEAGDVLDLGNVWIPVPMASVDIERAGDDELLRDDLIVMVDRQQLSQAPNFEAGEMPSTMDPDWDTDIRQYWETQ